MAENLKPIQGINTITKAWKLEGHSDNRHFGKYQASFLRLCGIVRRVSKRIVKKPKNYHLGKLFIFVDTKTLDKSSLTHF